MSGTGVPTEDVELLKIDEENYAITGTDTLERLSDDNIGDDVPILNKPDVEEKPEVTKDARIWHLAYYQDWFDITTELAVFRLKQALSPWNNKVFYSTNGEKLDLYCPFWIAATLTFLIAAMSNIARYFDSSVGAVDNWRSNAVELTTTSSIIAGFYIIVPLVIYALLHNTASPRKFVEVLSIYGYSLTVYLPGAVILGIPSNAFRWVVLLLCAGFSASFLIRNLWLTSQEGWSSLTRGNGIPCLLVIVLSPVLFSFLIKVY